MLPELLGQIPADEAVLSVSGDGAYDTQGCHDAIARRGAEAIIPTRKNAKPWKARRPGAAARNEILRTTNRLGRAIWKKWSGYHRRSLVETKMRCFKLLGERVMARTFERQVVELQVRSAVLNRFTHLGTPGDAGCGLTPSGVRGNSASAELCNKAHQQHKQQMKHRNRKTAGLLVILDIASLLAYLSRFKILG